MVVADSVQTFCTPETSITSAAVRDRANAASLRVVVSLDRCLSRPLSLCPHVSTQTVVAACLSEAPAQSRLLSLLFLRHALERPAHSTTKLCTVEAARPQPQCTSQLLITPLGAPILASACPGRTSRASQQATRELLRVERAPARERIASNARTRCELRRASPASPGAAVPPLRGLNQDTTCAGPSPWSEEGLTPGRPASGRPASLDASWHCQVRAPGSPSQSCPRPKVHQQLTTRRCRCQRVRAPATQPSACRRRTPCGRALYDGGAVRRPVRRARRVQLGDLHSQRPHLPPAPRGPQPRRARGLQQPQGRLLGPVRRVR